MRLRPGGLGPDSVPWLFLDLSIGEWKEDEDQLVNELIELPLTDRLRAWLASDSMGTLPVVAPRF